MTVVKSVTRIILGLALIYPSFCFADRDLPSPTPPSQSLFTWRWGPGSRIPVQFNSISPWSRSPYFESGAKWGWPEWLTVVGGVAAVAAIVVVATHKSSSGSSGSGSSY